MLGVGALGQLALAQFPGAANIPISGVGLANGIGAAPGIGAFITSQRLGWFDGWDRRRIPVEQLRAILKAQGSRWADELADAVEVAEKKAAKAPKRRKVIEEVLAAVSEKLSTPGVDWAAVCVSLLALASASRETLARKHAERIALLLADDEEEAIVLLLMDNY